MDQQLKNHLDQASNRVDQAIEHFLDSSRNELVENLHDGVLYALGVDQTDLALRGKRIRPALCLVTCQALGGDPEDAVPFAMAVELMHNFFLVHDDIQDGDEFRRGRPSVWKRYGLAHGINIGDYLFVQLLAAFRADRAHTLDPDLQLRLLDLLVFTLDRTHVGQALDMNALARDEVSVNDYMSIVQNKTGYYLAAPMVGGAMIAGADEAVLEAIRNLGRCAGPVFQIIDDTIDLTHGKGRETVGSDIREGKRSFLVAWTASHADEEDRVELFRILNLPRDETTSENVEWVGRLFEKHGAIEAGRNTCEHLMSEGREAMQTAPEPLRHALLGIFEGLLDRKR